MNEHDAITPEERELVRRLAAATPTPRGACPEATDLAAYLDGRVADDLAARLEEHLAGCDACRRAVVEARAALAEAPGLPTSELIARARALVAEPRPAPRWRSVVPWAAAAAAALALGVAGLSAGSAVGRSRRPPASDVVAALPLELASADAADDLFARLAANGEEASHE